MDTHCVSIGMVGDSLSLSLSLSLFYSLSFPFEGSEALWAVGLAHVDLRKRNRETTFSKGR